MTIHTIDEALAYLSRDPKSVEAECAGVLRVAIDNFRAEVLCRDCGKPVELERRVYVVPTCYACLPPPAPLPVLTELPGGKRG